ncbi:probable ATP-dependent RNA helicase Dhr2p [Trichomonascus vanleenenianus]|uniref:RNA helicase n=1 Tax=Trichomonascus vanleenenianus TaxID=2268995 RepID=UPI003EC9B88E
MGPRKHKRFDEEESADSLPGPLNLGRLNAIASNVIELSEGDSRFHSSSSSDDERYEQHKKLKLNGKLDTLVNGSMSGRVTETTNHSKDSARVNGLTNHSKANAKVNDKNGSKDTEKANGSINTNGSMENGKANGSVNKKSSKDKNVRSGRSIKFMDSEDEEEESQPKKLSKQQAREVKARLLKDRENLPIYRARETVLKHVFGNRVTVLLGETGSGKSTQLPQLIYEAHPDKEQIAITQPRRVAAVNLATRVSEENGCVLGTRVGYSVRFENRSNHKLTKIKYLTDGMLLREMILDRDLKKYTTIILDEAHERTVLTDLLMGLFKQLLARRPTLRLVVMSATLDADKFSKFFWNAPIVYVEGKIHPVQRYYLSEPVDDAVDAVVQSVCQVNMAEPTGDILVFLAGQEEIDKCVDRLNAIAPELPKEAPFIVALPLYAALPPAAQQKVFQLLAARRRKVIVATNIAETSLTIPGVRYVVDSGLRKVKVWKPELGLDMLVTTAISQASAAQRMGRAGREAPGKCYRLFTESTYVKELNSDTEPEILRCDVASTILMLKQVGVNNVLDFEWVESPHKKAIHAALVKLYTLKALDENGAITALGREMVLLPVSPPLAAVLIHAKKSSTALLSVVVDIAACLSIEDLIMNPHPDERDAVNEQRARLFGGGREHGDLIMLRELFDMYRSLSRTGMDRQARREWCKKIGVNAKGLENAQRVRKQLLGYLKVPSLEDAETSSLPVDDIVGCFLQGYVSHTALGLPDRRFKTTVHQQTLNIHPSSMLFGTKPEAIMYMDYVYTNKSYARIVTPVSVEAIQAAAPHFLARSVASS